MAIAMGFSVCTAQLNVALPIKANHILFKRQKVYNKEVCNKTN
jgi:hypothetical protein